jgi:UDP-N-acetylmuramate dehydrogenase
MSNLARVTAYSAFKTPATAEIFFDFIDRSQIPDLLDIVKEANSKKFPILHIGSGTNCLFAFDHFPGLIIRHRLRGITTMDAILTTSSGEQVSSLCTQLANDGISNAFVPWIGLPGTFWGAIVGNAGCFGLETADILLSAEVLDLVTGIIATLSSSDFKFAYRESILKGDSSRIVLSGTWNLALKQSNIYAQKTVAEMQALRRTKQPPGPSCGSYFKNPPSTSAGLLIDQAGLKRARVGGMQISEHHANFFINTGAATYQDVLDLAELAKQTVFQKTGITLQEEVRIIRS